MNNVLDMIEHPSDLASLSLDELSRLADEVRELIIKTVSANGGHLASNLGTVELTIALLRVFRPPTDALLWDVSHQAYAYKILTGRKDRFVTLRQTEGLSGFLSRSESLCDAFGAGHAGTALSAALGMAVARDRLGGREHVVSIIGDGALGCGSSLEALNQIAGATRRFIVVLNDNEMSISANVGSVARYLGNLLSTPRYNRWKSSVEHFARYTLGLGWLRNAYFRLEEAVKSLFLDSVIFEEFGLRYIGPIDGHDIKKLTAAFEMAALSDEPLLLHVSTQKGRGYALAEAEPDIWHGTAAFECSTGKPLKPSATLKYSEVFAQTLERLAEKDERLVAITAAMAMGTGLTGFARRFPPRFFDVGIAEEHAVIFAAGMACKGFIPVVAMYSTFSQRVVDYIIHDVCLQELPVIFCLDRAGLVGDDGPTHHGVFDVSLFRSVPNLILMQPKDEAELANMLRSAIEWKRPAIIRYPRGAGPGAALPERPDLLTLGQAEVLRPGREVQIWALGDRLPLALRVAEKLEASGRTVGLVNPRFVNPLDEELLKRQAGGARVIVTIENGVAAGGFGSGVGEALARMRYSGTLLSVGWPNRFIPHGTVEVMAARYGMTDQAIADTVIRALE